MLITQLSKRPHASAMLFAALVLFSCGPSVRAVMVEGAQVPYAIAPGRPIEVLGVAEPIPEGAIKLGTVKIGDTGFSTSCGWERVLAEAKNEARKAGGDLIKITAHEPPGFASSCHHISAVLLWADSTIMAGVAKRREATVDSTWDYAMLYVYRSGGVGPLVSYNLHLGDSMICRVKNKSTFEIKINQEMRTNLWARTEARSEVPLDVRFGHSYYLRCAVQMGAFVGQPFLELVDPVTGKFEYDAIVAGKKK